MSLVIEKNRSLVDSNDLFNVTFNDPFNDFFNDLFNDFFPFSTYVTKVAELRPFYAEFCGINK